MSAVKITVQPATAAYATNAAAKTQPNPNNPASRLLKGG